MLLSSLPTGDGQACALADWIEFKVLISEYKLYRFSELLRVKDEQQESENPDITEQDAINERVLETAVEELTHRAESLSYAYPFYFDADSKKLEMHEELNVGQYVYLYCLFYSHVNSEDVLIPSPPTGKLGWDLMQICSTLAAAGIVNGNSVSFGSPRPDQTTFFQALKKTYHTFGEVRVRQKTPPGAPNKVKDGGIDIIAWENPNDGAPGYRYLLGQVASGANWLHKTVKNDIDVFHTTWFFNKPASTPNPAMFIPFCLEAEKGVTRNERIGYLTEIFGAIYYRYRLPKFAQDGWELDDNRTGRNYRIDRINEINKLEDYVNDFMAVLSSHPWINPAIHP